MHSGPSAEDQPDDENQEQQTADPAAYRRATIVKATPTAEEDEQDQHEKNKVHAGETRGTRDLFPEKDGFVLFPALHFAE